MHLCVGRHPNVVELRALAQQGSALYMVMEYFPRGTLEVRALGVGVKVLPQLLLFACLLALNAPSSSSAGEWRRMRHVASSAMACGAAHIKEHVMFTLRHAAPTDPLQLLHGLPRCKN